ncbi:MAG: LysR family transcriptional regulator [Myxococcota bacterium]
MDWDALRFVLAIGRHRTLSAAGAALGVRHSTVGRQLARLEAELGVRLFDRTPEGFVPTDSGVELVELGEALEARIHGVEARVRGQDQQLEGALRVSTLDMLFEAFADVYASFRTRYPGIELTVTCTETEVSLFRREADVAVRMTNTPPETLVGRRLGEVRFAIYGQRALVGECPDPNALPWLHWDERLDAYVRWMDGFKAEVAPDAPLAMRLGEGTLIRRAAIRQGIGIHPLPCFEGDRYDDLVRLGPGMEGYTRQLWLLTLPALRDTRRVRAFSAHFTEALRDHPALRYGQTSEVG